MKKTIVFLLLVIFIGNFLYSFSVSAGEYQGYGGTVKYEGLVPCGKSSVGPNETEGVTKSCQLCHLFVMLDGIIDFVLLDVLPYLVVLMILIAGVMFYFAGGNPNLLLQAKKLITSVVIGLIIILCAYLIIGTILTVLGVQSWTTLDQWAGEGSFQVICPIVEGGGSVDNVNNVNNVDNVDNVDDEEESECGDCGLGHPQGWCYEPECTALGDDCIWEDDFWVFGGNCYSDPAIIDPGPTVPISDYTEDECTDAELYWYDGECHEEEETITAQWLNFCDPASDRDKPSGVYCGEVIEGTEYEAQKTATISCDSNQDYPDYTKVVIGDCIPANDDTSVSSYGIVDGKWSCTFVGKAIGQTVPSYNIEGRIYVLCSSE